MLLVSCDKDSSRQELFEIPLFMDFDIPAGLNTVESHFFVAPALRSNYQELLASSGFTDDNVTAIEPKFGIMSTVFNDEDLDFIRLVEVRVFDPFDPELKREAFYLDPVPGNTGTVIRPFPGLANLKEILSQPTYGVEIRLVFINTPRRAFDMRLEMEFQAYQ